MKYDRKENSGEKGEGGERNVVESFSTFLIKQTLIVQLTGTHKGADKASTYLAAFLWRKSHNGCARPTLID